MQLQKLQFFTEIINAENQKAIKMTQKATAIFVPIGILWVCKKCLLLKIEQIFF